MSASFAFCVRLFLGALIACTGSVLRAQEAAPAAPPAKPESSDLVIRESVRRVALDVVVTDSNNKPVHGLTRQDFSVTEDGTPQRVVSFDVHDYDEIPESLAASPTKLPPNTFVNVPAVPERGPLYVILYDMVNMQTDDQISARKQLLGFIHDKPPGVRFAIFVLSDGFRLVQGFTADQSELFAAMDPKTRRPHVPKVFLYGDNWGVGEVGAIVSAFTQIAHYLNGLPGRKILIWMTGSLVTSILPTSNPGVQAVDYSDEIKQAITAMARSQVAVYPVDVRGVVVPRGFSITDPNHGATRTTVSTQAINASYATEEDIAIATGGHAFMSRNDVKDAMVEATETGANYYTLSYSPSNQKYDGQLRKLHVELSRKGCQLAYRRSYYAYDPDSPPASDNLPAQRAVPARSSKVLFASIRHGAPLAHDLLFKARVQAVGKPAKATREQMSNIEKQLANFGAPAKNQTVKRMAPVPLQAYTIDFAVLRSSHGAEPRQPALEFATAAYDEDGQVLNGIVQFAAAGATTEHGGSASRGIYRAQQEINVPLTATSIRLAVLDIATDRIGAMEVPLPLVSTTEAGAPTPDPPTSREGVQPKPN